MNMPLRFQDRRNKLAEQAPQKWMDNLAPKVAELRQELARRDPVQVAQRSGAAFNPKLQTLEVRLWDKSYTLTHPEYIARDSSGAGTALNRQALLLMYLHTADGAPLAHNWVTYRELPGGLFYADAFHGYAEMRLARSLSGVEQFCAAALALKGDRLTFGTASFEFKAMPRILVGAVYWVGDEDFASSATILFDAAASHYLPTDAVGALGSQLVSRLLGHADEDAQTLTSLAVQPPPE
jgi:hypothetical protein